MPSGRPSHFGAAVRLAVAAVRRRGRSDVATAGIPARKLAVERRGIEVDPSQLRRYLEASRGEGLYNALASQAPLPPTYPAVWETALTLDLLALDGVPFPSGGLVHLASEVVVVRPLTVADRIRCRVELETIEPHARGSVLVLKVRSWNAAGQLAQENSTRLLARSRGAAGVASRGLEARTIPEEEQAEPLAWREIAGWSLPAVAGVRYARASGDFNPIHLWSWSSRLLGYSSPILHGHCSVAMMIHELARATGRSTRRIDVRFRAPLELPGRVRLEASGDPGGGMARVRLVNADGAGRPYVEGVWVG